MSDHISDDDDGDEDAITEDATANSNASNDGYIYHASAYHASSGGQNGDGDAAASDSRASGSISGRRGFAIKTASSSFWPGALTAATQPSTHAEPAADPGTPSAAAEGIPDALASSTLATAASAAASAAGAAAGVPADYYSDNLMCARCAKLLPNDPLLECHRPPHRRSCERCSKSHLACIPVSRHRPNFPLLVFPLLRLLPSPRPYLCFKAHLSFRASCLLCPWLTSRCLPNVSRILAGSLSDARGLSRGAYQAAR